MICIVGRVFLIALMCNVCDFVNVCTLSMSMHVGMSSSLIRLSMFYTVVFVFGSYLVIMYNYKLI